MPGEAPLDLIVRGVPVIDPTVDELMAEIVALGGRAELEDRYGFFYWSPPSFKHELDNTHPIPADLEDQLRCIRDRREREARAGGWEVDRLLEEARRQRGEQT